MPALLQAVRKNPFYALLLASRLPCWVNTCYTGVPLLIFTLGLAFFLLP